MGLIDKIRNASLQRRINKRIQENNISQATPEIVVQAIVEETMNNKVLVENTKTLQRLGILETASTWNIEQTLNHNKSIINLNTRVTTLEKVIEDQPKTKRADEVLDTFDNTYKDVKHIQVNRATKSDMVLWPDTNEYYPVDELPFLAKYLTVDGGTITGSLEVNNQLTMNGDLVATQKWVQEHGGGGGSIPEDELARLQEHIDAVEDDLQMHKSEFDDFKETEFLNAKQDINTLQTNSVDLTSEQTISGVKTFNNNVKLNNTKQLNLRLGNNSDKSLSLYTKNNSLDGFIKNEAGDIVLEPAYFVQMSNKNFAHLGEPTRADSAATKQYVDNAIANIPSQSVGIKVLEKTQSTRIDAGWQQRIFEWDKPDDFDLNTSKFWTHIYTDGSFNGLGEKDVWVEGNKLKVSIGVNGGGGANLNITCKLFYISNEGGVSPGIDLSEYVRKDETLEELCQVDECPWAVDIQSQIDSNGRLIGKMWDEGKVGGRAFGNVEQNIATQEWVKEEFSNLPSDQPGQTVSDDHIKRVVQKQLQDESIVIYTAKNNPRDDNNTWITQYRYDGIRTRGNPQLEPNAKWLYIKHPTQPVWDNLGGAEHREVTLASEEWVVPKLHAINLIYNFQSSQIIKHSEDFVPYKHIVWQVKIEGWCDFVMKHWPEDELAQVKHWGKISCFMPPQMIDIDWVRNPDGGTNYRDEHFTNLIGASYDTNGSLILTIRVNGLADSTSYNSMINHLVIIVYKFGQPLLTTNDPTIDDEVADRPIIEWKPKNFKLKGRR